MAEEHPLTDAICEEIADTEDRPYAFRYCRLTYIEMNNMRAAADWQLEKVLEWLITNTEDYLLQDYYKTYFLTEAFLDGFKKAMRPTTQEEK